MLVIPRYEDYVDKSLETLIEIRQKVIKEIVEYEDKYILHTRMLDKSETEIIENPSPKVRYIVNNDKLEMLTRIINLRLEKQIEEKIESKDTDNTLYYYVFVEYEDDTYGREYCYISEDTTIDIGDLVLVDKRGEETIARITMTKFCTYANAPYPVDRTKHIIKLVEKFEECDEGKENENINIGSTSTVSDDTIINEVDDDNDKDIY